MYEDKRKDKEMISNELELSRLRQEHSKIMEGL